MRTAATTLCLAFVLSAFSSAGAEPDPHQRRVFDQPLPAAQVAHDLRLAADADDEAAIRALAASLWPDPFEVAARMLFPPTPGGKPTAEDKEALARFAEAASDETGVRAFIEYWLEADDDDFERERELWRISARVMMRIRAGEHAAALGASDPALPLLAATEHSHQGPAVSKLRAQALRLLNRPEEGLEVLSNLADQLRRRGWPAFEGNVRNVLAQGLRGIGRPDAAVLAECRRADKLLTRARNWKPLIDVLGLQATCQIRLRRFAEAEETAYRALVVAAETARLPQMLSAKLTLAGVTHASGRPDAATTLRREAFERARGAELFDLAAWAAGELVWTELGRGRTAAALAHGDWLEDHLDRVLSPWIRADTSLALGDLAASRGQREEALAHFRLALEVHRGASSPGRAFSVLVRIVRLETADGSLTSAGEAALSDLRATAELAARASDTIPVLTDWSRTELRLGHHEAAAKIAQRAVAWATAHPDAHRAYLAPLQLAHVETAQNRWQEAVALLEPLIDRLPEHGGSRLLGLNRLGIAYCGAGRWADAVSAYRQAVTLQRRRRSGVGAREALPMRETEHTLATRGVRAAEGWARTDASGAALEAAWWFTEMAGGQLLASALADGPPAAPTEIDVYEALPLALEDVERAHGRVVRAILEGDTATQREARDALRNAHEVLSRIEARAERRAGRPADLSEPVSLARLREGLPADTALLAYTMGPEGVCGLVVTSDDVRVRLLDTLPDTRRLVSRWRRLASTPDGPDAKLASRLYDRLVRPFEDLVAARPQWIVLPDGALSGVPMDAWIRRTPEGSTRLIEAHTLTYAHGHDVLEALAERQAARDPGRGVVALGDPSYPRTRSLEGTGWQQLAALERGGLHMPALPSSGDEVRSVAALYPEAHRTVLLGGQAARSEWLTAISRSDAPLDCIHLACHGLVDDQLPSLSGLVFAGGEMLTAERLQETRVLADLVVLSACQSGGETLAVGEGLLGLTRAFFRSGVTRVVCTTWQVADASTAQLMIQFHEGRRREGLSDAAALRRARLALMRDPATAHPHYWAGFQLWGAAGR